jgi:transposase-like protein
MSAEQREALLDEFERSGLKGAQFARAAGVRYSTFAYWVQQRRHARGDYARRRGTARQPQGGALRLVEAVAAGTAAAQAGSGSGALEVLLPGGAKALVGNARQALLAAELIKALCRPC